MRTNVAIASGKSNLSPAKTGEERNEMGRALASVNAALRKNFGSKTWASIAFLLKLPERTAKHRLAGTRPYDFDDAIKLLRAEVGFDVLTAIMGDKKHWPAWFKICARKIKEAKLLTDMKQMQLLIEQSNNETAAEVAKLSEEA